MSLITQLHDLAGEMAAEFKALKQKIAGNISGDLSGLATTAKASIVSSVNEVKTAIAGKQPLIGFTPENASKKGAANGYASLDSGGKVPSAQLPSFVDDVIEAASLAGLPATGVTGVIYVTRDTNLTYRWSGSAYVEISKSLALGETSATAYRGDRGKSAYDHSQIMTTAIHHTGPGDPWIEYTPGNPHGTPFALLAGKPTTVAGYSVTDLNTKPEVGTPTTDFVANFEAALV